MEHIERKWVIDFAVKLWRDAETRKPVSIGHQALYLKMAMFKNSKITLRMLSKLRWSFNDNF